MKDFYKIIKTLKTKDVVVAILIVALPFLFYLYKLAPDTPVWETGWFRINSGSWESAYLYLWLIFTKLLLIISLSIWFITCKHWWRYVILVPLIIELFKFSFVFSNSAGNIDELDYLQSLPLTIPVILFVVLLSNKVGYFSKHQDLNTEMNNEIESLLHELELNNNKAAVMEEFEALKKTRELLSTDDYKNKLLKLRQQLFNL